MNCFLTRRVELWLVIATLLLPRLVSSAEVPVAPLAPVTSPTNAVLETDPQLLRNFLLLQDQLRATQHAVEQAREAAQAESKHNAELMASRLNLIEQTLNAQRQQELDSLQHSMRTMLLVVGLITAIGFIAIFFAGVMQARALARLAEFSQQLRTALPAPRFAELGGGAALSVAGEPADASTHNLLGAIDRLQRRLEEMETAAATTQTSTNGHKQIAAPTPNPKIGPILGQGQSLLNLDQPEEALERFEEALVIDPQNVEAWIKKGTALERLQRTEEAVAAYDQAIAADNCTATAYLFKAGVFNRQKKYAEALQCYEKALSVQQKSRSGAAAKV